MLIRMGKTMQNEKSLRSSGFSKEWIPTPVNNQADKDKEAEEATTRNPSVPVVTQRNGVLPPWDNQRNASATTRKGKKEHEHKHKGGRREKEKVEITKIETPNHQTKTES